MTMLRTKMTMGNSLSVLALTAVLGLSTWTTGLKVAIAVQQEKDEASHATAPAPIQTIAVDEGQFELRSPSKDDDTPGILKYGGYAEQAIVRQSRYRSETGGATVEVVKHPPGYPYARHDFLGTFFHVYQEEKNKKGHDAGEVVTPVEYVKWQTVEPPTSHTLCVLSTFSNGSYHGVAGWYAESDEGMTTVMVRFGAPAGLPRTIIDQFLKKHPSSIHGTVPSLQSWEADDIDKWATLLETRGNEDSTLSMATKHLRRYDGANAFGLHEIWDKRNDSAVRSAGVKAALGRMKDWLQERKETITEPEQPKD